MFDVLLTLLFLVAILRLHAGRPRRAEGFLLLGLGDRPGNPDQERAGPISVAGGGSPSPLDRTRADAPRRLVPRRASRSPAWWPLRGISPTFDSTGINSWRTFPLASLESGPWRRRRRRPWWSHFDYLRELAHGLLALASARGCRCCDRDPAGIGPARCLGIVESRAIRPGFFFSGSSSSSGSCRSGAEKKLWYVMTAFPCLALYAGLAAGRVDSGESLRHRVQLWGFGLLGAAAVALWLFPIPLSKERAPRSYSGSRSPPDSRCRRG